MPRQSRFVERWPLSKGDSTWRTPTRSRTVRANCRYQSRESAFEDARIRDEEHISVSSMRERESAIRTR